MSSGLRSLKKILARPRAQPQVGERPGETCVPYTALFVSFSFSVIAKAAAVAMSRPTRVTVERSRCKAPRFYGSFVRIRS